MPSLSAEDLIMAMHKASSRRIEVLSRTTGNVDQVSTEFLTDTEKLKPSFGGPLVSVARWATSG